MLAPGAIQGCTNAVGDTLKESESLREDALIWLQIGGTLAGKRPEVEPD